MRPRLLFVSPVSPRTTGSGVRMRAALQITALSRFFDIDLVVINAPASPVRDEIDPQISALCRGTRVFTAGRSRFAGFYEALTNEQLKVLVRALHPRPMSSALVATSLPALDAFLRESDYDVAYAYRLWTSLFVARMASAMPARKRRLVVDFDDLESEFTLRLARAMRRQSGLQIALLNMLEAYKLRCMERRAFRVFDDVCVCSELDREKILRAHGALGNVAVLPNVVGHPAPSPVGPRDHAIRPPVLLYVGSLDYLPNIDGLRFLATEILPHLREKAAIPFEVRVVGRAPGPDARAMCERAGFALIADAESLASHYREAAAAVVPLRLGGGTRIKILEAFSHGVAVVSTTIGAEGIDAEGGKEILIADDPADFARHCLDLIAGVDRRNAIARAGYELFERKYSVAALENVFASMLGVKSSAPPERASAAP